MRKCLQVVYNQWAKIAIFNLYTRKYLANVKLSKTTTDTTNHQ